MSKEAQMAPGRILFVSNLFPDQREPIRGLDNATVLNQMTDQGWAVKALGVRPVYWPSWLPDARRAQHRLPRREDEDLHPQYIEAPYIPRIGALWNARLMASAIRPVLLEIDRTFNPHLILGSWLFPDGWAISKIAEELGKPVYLICQGSDAHQYLKSPVRRKHILEACASSTAVITRSGSLAIHLAQAGVSPEKLHPILNGVNLHVFHPGARDEARRKVGCNSERPLLLFVGNLLPVKNPLFLLRAWKQLREGTPPDQRPLLAMAGSGPLEQEIRHYAAIHHLQDDLMLLGRLEASAIADWMRASDTLCLSSHNEGLPNVILEAFACGLPVVSTSVGGIAEVFAEEYLGRLVAPGDGRAFAKAILECLSFRSSMREPIAAYGNRFSWQHTGNAYQTLFSRRENGERLSRGDGEL